jgi:hypothetical protein
MGKPLLPLCVYIVTANAKVRGRADDRSTSEDLSAPAAERRAASPDKCGAAFLQKYEYPYTIDSKAAASGIFPGFLANSFLIM